MTKAELVDEVGREAALTRKHSEVIVDAVFSSIVEALQRGDKIELRGFGSFRIRSRGARIGRNPKTGNRVEVPPDLGQADPWGSRIPSRGRWCGSALLHVQSVLLDTG